MSVMSFHIISCQVILLCVRGREGKREEGKRERGKEKKRKREKGKEGKSNRPRFASIHGLFIYQEIYLNRNSFTFKQRLELIRDKTLIECHFHPYEGLATGCCEKPI